MIVLLNYYKDFMGFAASFLCNMRARSLSDLGNRHEKWINLGQIFMVLRRIVDLFNEKPGEYGQI